jgi:hypothetical protein
MRSLTKHAKKFGLKRDGSKLTSVIPDIQEAEIGKMVDQGQPRQKVNETLESPSCW